MRKPMKLATTDQQTVYNWNWSDGQFHWTIAFIECVFSAVCTYDRPKCSIVYHLLVAFLWTRCGLHINTTNQIINMEICWITFSNDSIRGTLKL